MTSFEKIDELITATRDQWLKDPEFHSILYTIYERIDEKKPLTCADFLRIGAGSVYKEDYFSLTNQGEVRLKKFGITGITNELKFRNFDNLKTGEAIENKIVEVFDKAVGKVFKDNQVSKHDRVGLEIKYGELTKGSILMPFCLKGEINGRRIIRLIDNVIQSYEKINMHEPLTMKVVFVKNPHGSGRVEAKFSGNRLKQKQYYTKQKNKRFKYICTGSDMLCLPRSIVMARIFRDEGTVALKLAKKKKYFLTESSKELMESCDIKHQGPCSFDDLRKIQENIPERIVVFDRNVKEDAGIIFNGERPAFCEKYGKKMNNNVIALELHNNHYTWLSSITAFLQCSYFCVDCRKKYNTKTNHSCETSMCKYCFVGRGTCEAFKWKLCEKCFRNFPSLRCYNNHLKKKKTKSTCELKRLCTKCGCEKLKDHKCYTNYCSICNGQKNTDHVCFLQPHKRAEYLMKINKELEWPGKCENKIICFDFETIPDENNEHRVVLAVAQVFCDFCKLDWGKTCEKCMEEPEVIFHGDNCLELFCEWLFDDCHAKSTAFAHNAKNFDNLFIVRYLINHAATDFEVIPRGMSIMMLTAAGVKMLCSYNFLPMPLRKLPQAFGFANEVVKGYFPHEFMTFDRLNETDLEWPDIHYYGIEYMKPDERKKVISWYETVKHRKFNPLEEMTFYCKADVSVLRKAISIFRDLMKKHLLIDPFTQSATIASACLLGFKHCYLKPDTMQIIYENKSKSKQSIEALKYLEYRRTLTNDEIRLATSFEGEQMIRCAGGKMYIDAVFYNEKGEITKFLEYLGCYYHGCPTCFPHKRLAKHLEGGKTFDQIYQETANRIRNLRLMYPNIPVEIVWSHQVHAEMEENDEVKYFIKNVKVGEPIHARDAFFGGRVEPINMFYEVKKDETIQIADFTSLYPAVNKYCPYPVGAGTVFNRNIKVEIINGKQHLPYFGIVKLKIVPRKKLLYPVLPIRTKTGRLVFGLCSICIESQSTECSHTNDERSWIGTYTTVEVNYALKRGYEICDEYGKFCVFEVWHWGKTEIFNPNIPDSGLFTKYVNNFLELKTCASGYPDGVTTEKEKEEYIKSFYELEGIDLPKDKIENNPALRQIAKLALTNLWGKFVERTDRGQLKYVSQTKKFYDIMFDEKNEIQTLIPVSDEMIAVNYKIKEEYRMPAKGQAIMHGIFTTAFGRLKLHSYMEKLGEQLCYCDSDSYYWIKRPGGYELPLGNGLGELKDELRAEEYVAEFVCTAAKCYSLLIKNKATGECRYETKIKGFTLDYHTSKRINHETMKEMVKEYVEEGKLKKIEILRPTMKRSKQSTIKNIEAKKTLSVVATKRIVLPNFSSVPFGYYNDCLT